MSFGAPDDLEAREGQDGIKPDRLKLDDLESGQVVVMERTREALEKSEKRPQVLFVNGMAGAGKSYFSEQLKEEMERQGVKSIFLETDMYHETPGTEVYTHDDFFRQKQAWESRQDFEYFNTAKGEKEIVNGAALDVIIVGGIGATRELGLDPYSEVFVSSPFINRLANKAFRDHVLNADEPTVERFMDEIANPPEGQDYLAHALEQELAGRGVERNSDIVISNSYDDGRSKFWLEGDVLKFRAENNGETIESERRLDAKRMELFRQILDPEGVQTGVREQIAEVGEGLEEVDLGIDWSLLDDDVLYHKMSSYDALFEPREGTEAGEIQIFRANLNNDLDEELILDITKFPKSYKGSEDELQVALIRTGESDPDKKYVAEFDFARFIEGNTERWDMKHRRTGAIYQGQGIASKVLAMTERFLKDRAGTSDKKQLLSAGTGQPNLTRWLRKKKFEPIGKDSIDKFKRIEESDPNLQLFSAPADHRMGNERPQGYLFDVEEFEKKFPDIENGPANPMVWDGKNYDEPFFYMKSCFGIRLGKEIA
jgi:hypothetical protein